MYNYCGFLYQVNGLWSFVTSYLGTLKEKLLKRNILFKISIYLVTCFSKIKMKEIQSKDLNSFSFFDYVYTCLKFFICFCFSYQPNGNSDEKSKGVAKEL